jgi:hypothetical protein
MISFDELDLMMQQKNGASQPETSPYARDFLDYMSQVTSNSAGYAGDSHAASNTELKPLTNFELSRVAIAEPIDGEIGNQPYEIQNMNIDLGKGGQLPNSFEVGLRPQYELENYV